MAKKKPYNLFGPNLLAQGFLILKKGGESTSLQMYFDYKRSFKADI